MEVAATNRSKASFRLRPGRKKEKLRVRCAVVRIRHDKETISGGYGEGVPPVPIPNTVVKPFSADGTWLDTARKSRSPPDSNTGGSNSTFCLNSSMAEHSAVNRRVVGSSPS